MFESCFEICRLLANAEIPFELFYRVKNAYIGVYREEKVTIKRITDVLSSVCVFVFDEEEKALISFNNPNITVEIIDL